MQLYNGLGTLVREFEPTAGKEKMDVSGLRKAFTSSTGKVNHRERYLLSNRLSPGDI
jgi:hypothetical protein